MLRDFMAIDLLIPFTPVRDDTENRVLVLLNSEAPYAIGYKIGGGGGNPFDQSLNTTDNVRFNSITISSNTQILSNYITTTNANPTTILSVSGSASSEMGVKISVSYHIVPWTAGGGSTYDSNIGVLFSPANIPTITGPYSIFENSGPVLLGATVTILVSGSNVIVTANGLPNTTINWTATITAVSAK